jgi:hypothetical protein
LSLGGPGPKSNDGKVGANTDNDPDFTDDFCGFLQRNVTNVDAAELLLLLFQHPDTAWQPQELVTRLQSVTALVETDVRRHLDLFERSGLVARDPEQRVRYRIGSEAAHVAALARLYLERPVTLFRVIYALRDSKISTFADAFNLRR